MLPASPGGPSNGRSAQDSKFQRGQIRVEIVRGALDEPHVHGGFGRIFARGIQHFRLGIEPDHISASEACEGDAERSWSAAEIEYTIAGFQAGAFGDAFDQPVRIGDTEAVVVERQWYESAGLRKER